MGAEQSSIGAGNEEEDAVEPLRKEYAFDRRLFPGSGRMMRTFKFSRREDGLPVVAKCMWIRGVSVEDQQRELEMIKERLSNYDHVAPFDVWKLGELRSVNNNIRAVALIRNYVYTTLSDRLQSRPFLTNTEKLWIIHQFLGALQHMHSKQVCHGFLTTENIGLTSWNYLVITDIASYKTNKPLPDDDPSEYLYYFQEAPSQRDTTPREKRCYLAPERFYSPSTNNQSTTEDASSQSTPDQQQQYQLTPAMDVFSAGCVMLETFLTGERALDLGDLMDYRKQQEFPPSLQQKFQKIESSSLRAACRHMLSLDPSQRLSPLEYRERLSDLPPTFETPLEPFMERITTQPKTTPDARISLASVYYGQVVEETTGIRDHEGIAYLEQVVGPTLVELEANKGQVDESASKNSPSLPTSIDNKHTAGDVLLAETEALLRKLANFDFDLAEDNLQDNNDDDDDKPALTEEVMFTPSHQGSKKSLLVFVQMILSNLRHVQRPSSKIVALELLRRLAKYSSDETRLQRIIPTAISVLQDQEPLVRAKGVQVMTTTLCMIRGFSPSDANIFPQYIFKRVSHLITDPSLVVRVMFAGCIPVLAETAHRFLDISHAVRLYEAVGGGGGATSTPKENTKEQEDPGVFADNVAKLLDGSPKDEIKERTDEEKNPAKLTHGNILITTTYNDDLAALQETVSRWVVHINTDQSEQSSPPKRALLKDLARLCNFFGRDGVMAFILPQVLAFLNDRRDWTLRASLFDDLPSASYIIGRAATEHFVLPCLETALVDGQDQVIDRALGCLASLVDMGLLSRSVLVRQQRNNDRQNEQGDKKQRYGWFDKYVFDYKTWGTPQLTFLHEQAWIVRKIYSAFIVSVSNGSSQCHSIRQLDLQSVWFTGLHCIPCPSFEALSSF